ncbi:hypothetical protein [Cronobacter phage vB_Cdu_VP8]|nr:hypothetical protein [Cronobacter phage vB_Cdu_VP8]
MNNVEFVREVMTVVSIVIKFGCEEPSQEAMRIDPSYRGVIAKHRHFVPFLVELGMKHPSGRELTVGNFRQVMTELTSDEKEELIEEFNQGFRHIYQYLAMMENAK